MHFYVEPPCEAQAGVALPSPIVVCMEWMDREGVPTEDHPDFYSCWGLVTIVAEDGTTDVAPPRGDLLSGSVSSPLHHLPSSAEFPCASIILFPDITLNETGRYKIRVSLFAHQVDSHPNGSVISIASAMSRVIAIRAEAEFWIGKFHALACFRKLSTRRTAAMGASRTHP